MTAVSPLLRTTWIAPHPSSSLARRRTLFRSREKCGKLKASHGDATTTPVDKRVPRSRIHSLNGTGMLRFLIGGAAFLPNQLNRASPMGLDNPYPFAASA